MQFAIWLFMVAFAYGIGIFWYDLLPGRLPHMTWRVAAHLFLLMMIGEAAVPFGPSCMGFHIITAIIAGLISVIIERIVTIARQPRTIVTLDTQSAPAHS